MQIPHTIFVNLPCQRSQRLCHPNSPAAVSRGYVADKVSADTHPLLHDSVCSHVADRALLHSTFSALHSYSTVGCRRTGGRRSQPGSFLFFTTPANLVLIFQSVFESCRLACSAHTVCDDARRRSGVVSKSAMLPKKSSSQQTLFACGETVLTSFFQPGVNLLFR